MSGGQHPPAPATGPTISGTGGRASALGPRRALFAAIVAALLVATLIVSLSGVLGSGGTTGARQSSAARSPAAVNAPSNASVTSSSVSAKYGGLPRWLPKPKVRVRRSLTATPVHPVLSIQGETVAVDLPGGHVLATVVGPEVPEEGHFPVPATSPCAFILTLASASGTVPVRALDFTFVDDQGGIHHPRLSALHGGVVPSTVPAGKAVSLKLYDVLPTGDGGLEWAPGGGRPLVGWDYTVEID
jgi:hypothetical protein